MDKRIWAAAAGAAVATMMVATAHASQCSNTCDQTYMQCDKSGATDCLPKWGQCKQRCTAPAAAPASPTQPGNTKPTTKPKG